MENWGTKSEEKFRITMSFYLQTDVIGPTLKEAYQHLSIKDRLSTTGWRLTSNVLHESAVKEISVEHTWRDDMAARLFVHLQTLRVNVPIAVQDNMIKTDEENAHVVSAFVGSKDATMVEKTLLKNPFKGCKMLLRCSKKSTPTIWKQTIAIHKQLSEATQAVQIVNADDRFLATLKTAMDADDSISDKYIDIA